MWSGERTIGQRVRDLAADVLGPVPGPEEALGLDSLGTAELVLALEGAFGVRLPDDATFRTLADAEALVARAPERAEPSPGSPEPGIGHLQWLAESLIGRVVGAYFRLEVHGEDHVPSEGPAVLAMNHDSLLDIPILVVATPRRVWFMAKEELFGGRFAAWFFHVLGGFPVRRGVADLRAVRASLHLLEGGRLLGMYPEGTRAPHLQPFLPGAAWLALTTGAPLVPASITGTADSMPTGSTIPKRTTVVVRFGEPIPGTGEGDPRARLHRARELTDDLRARVERLLPT